jgi:hypothetical protein
MWVRKKCVLKLIVIFLSKRQIFCRWADLRIRVLYWKVELRSAGLWSQNGAINDLDWIPNIWILIRVNDLTSCENFEKSFQLWNSVELETDFKLIMTITDRFENDFLHWLTFHEQFHKEFHEQFNEQFLNNF